ncbi:cytochrome P450 [Brumimicrobium mesophilum]|uniref:cytochrome P450 n=1 Tax=Brumimicrobium mesophilum TaxID=392717 RepID=UPI000D1414B3|nr:cytochrome P450 [Brumimicrobium mesophilum]
MNQKIKFNKSNDYEQTIPTLISCSISGESEIARWVMDINQIKHNNVVSNPGFFNQLAYKYTNDKQAKNEPIYQQTDKLIYGAKSIIHLFDQQIPKNRRLFPTDENHNIIIDNYYKEFTEELDGYIWSYIFSELFRSERDTKIFFKKSASFSQKLIYNFGLKSIKKTLESEYKIKDLNPIISLVEINKIFDKIDSVLEDGRHYLVGDKLSAADIALASIAGPLILPVEFGGTTLKFGEISEELREQIFKLRARPTGQFIMKLYQSDRPINVDLGALPKINNATELFFGKFNEGYKPKTWKVFYFLQKRLPVIHIGIAKMAIVTRQDLVVEVLKRDEDFTVKEINAKKMADQKGSFFLGMDRNNPQFDRERNFVRKSAKREDLDIIRDFIREKSEEICKNIDAYGKIDVVQSLNYPILIGLIDIYFGVPAPIESQMQKWQRTMFYDLFLNFTGNKEKHLAAVNSGKERTAWVRNLITERKNELKSGKEIDDNLLNRLILLQQEDEYSWVEDDTIRRNIGGLLTGLQETTSKAVIFALEELFKRPDQLALAIVAAKAYDMEKLKGFVNEALRFNPVQPGLIRFSETKQYLNGANNKKYKVKAKRRVLALTSGAMFDPITFPEPKKFIANRESRYMNWGFALHECYGGYINSVTIPELVGVILRMENVKLTKGLCGKGAGLKNGPFPNNFVVEFTSKN